LDALAEVQTRYPFSAAFSWLDADILAELFGNTDIGDEFVEPID
jgi:hypothetical protein